MKKIIKLLLTLIISVTALTTITGCTSAGDIKNPVNPIGTYKNDSKNTATVKFYRSSDHFGLLQFNDYVTLIDKSMSEKFVSDKTNPSDRMLTNREFYMSKEIAPGVHSFLMTPVAEQVARLEAGNVYYLAVSFHIGGLAGLQFRTRDDFLEAAASSKLVEWTGKCSAIWGCPTKIVNE